MPARSLTVVFAMSVVCALLLGGVLYLRLNGGGGLARAGLLVASLTMAGFMLHLAGRAGANER